MKKLEEAIIYDCPTKFTITKCEAGWTNINCDFNGTVLNFNVSCIGRQPTALVEVAFLLNSFYDNYEGLLDIHVDEEQEVVDQEGNEGWTASLGAEFLCDEEPRINEWHITSAPEDFGKEDYNLNINIVRSTGEGEEKYDFTVSYRDFCYAVAKCFTDALKQYGFYGYDTRSYTDRIIVRQLLIIKAYALGILSTKISACWELGDEWNLDFEEELKLLVMDM